MNRQHLLSLAPRLGARADIFVEALNNAMASFGIDTPARQAAFLGQVVHESAGLTRMTEDLNYSPGTLMACFNNSKVTRFTPEMAALYARTVYHQGEPADDRECGIRQSNGEWIGRVG